ncbi:MAG: hypothetical protein A4E42_02461 [Methanoregulaceae archaeon PtaU1.Bin222]|nr:MAG: hypothetical protein A4E42_02461 [Methanoregulaceae archaeon PtaU1.Bin222]
MTRIYTIASTFVGELSFVITSCEGTSITWVRRSILITLVTSGTIHRNPGFILPVYLPRRMASPCS